MATPIVISAEIYINGAYVGQADETELSFMNNGEQLIAGQFVAESFGVLTTEGSIKSINTSEANQIELVQLTIDQTIIVLGYNTNGRSYQIEGKMIKGAITSNIKTGATKGTHNFRGGTPMVVPF
jgi:hypothetical protein